MTRVISCFYDQSARCHPSLDGRVLERKRTLSVYTTMGFGFGYRQIPKLLCEKMTWLAQLSELCHRYTFWRILGFLTGVDL